MIQLNHIGAAAFIVARRGAAEFVYEDINEACERMTGLVRETIVHRPIAEIMPPELVDLMCTQYQACMASRETAEYERVLRLPAGEIATRTTLTPIFEKPDEPVRRLLGVSVNVTEQYRLQEQLRTSNARLEIAMEAMGGAHWYFDAREKHFELSAAFDQIIGTSVPRRLRIDEWLQHVHPDDREDTCFANILAGRTREGTAEFRILVDNGDVRWLRCRRRAVARGGSLDGIAGVVVDITQEKWREAALSHQAASDPLTGLANRRRFEEVFSDERERSSLRRGALSLLMMDVDNFKAFNDSYGHVAGDRVLQKIAKAIADALGSKGMVARYGGEEFIALLPGFDSAAAVQVAERVIEAVRALREPHTGSTTGVVSISVGVAGHPRLSGNSGADLIALADAALYRAKHDGRDRYRVMVAPHLRAIDPAAAPSAA